MGITCAQTVRLGLHRLKQVFQMEEVLSLAMGLGAQEVISYLCIFANGLSKMPQIKRVHETQSVAGLSVTSILLPPPANLRNHLLLHGHRLHGRWRCPQVPHANCHERQHPTWPELKGRSNPSDPKRGNKRQRGGNGLDHKRRHWNDAAVHTSQLQGGW